MRTGLPDPSIALSAGVASDLLLKNKRFKKVMVLILGIVAMIMAATGYQRFHRYEMAHSSKEHPLYQLRDLLVQFRSYSTPKDVLHAYEIGEAVSLTSFYADRKVQYLTSSKEILAVYKKIPTDYVGMGVTRLIPDIRGLESYMQSQRGFFLVSKILVPQFQQDRIPYTMRSETKNFVILSTITRDPQ